MTANLFRPPTVEVTPDGIAIVPVIGTPVARSGYLGAASGLTAYSDIAESIEAAATDPCIHAILLDVDSSGGEVGGLFDLVDHIQAIRSQCGKPIWAVADEAALSAAYAIACTGDPPVRHSDRRGRVHRRGGGPPRRVRGRCPGRAGVDLRSCRGGEGRWQPASAAVRQRPRRPPGRCRCPVREIHALVAERRRLSPEAIRATEAAVYRGDQAVAAGLADKVGTLRVALADLGAVLARPTISRSIAARKEVPMSESQGDVPALAAVPQPPAQANADLEQRLRAEYSEISACATPCWSNWPSAPRPQMWWPPLRREPSPRPKPKAPSSGVPARPPLGNKDTLPCLC